MGDPLEEHFRTAPADRTACGFCGLTDWPIIDTFEGRALCGECAGTRLIAWLTSPPTPRLNDTGAGLDRPRA